MVSTLRVNGYTKDNYFAPECPKMSFSHYSSKKKPICNEKKFVILFLTLKVREAAIAAMAR